MTDGSPTPTGRQAGRRKWAMRAALILGALLLLLIGAWRLSRSRTFQIAGELVTRVETDSMFVALTFDDGPTPEGTRIALDLTRELDFPATFFLTGAEIEANPSQASAIVAAGHQVGNHSYSHRHMALRSPSFVRTEIESTDSLIRAAGYQGVIQFRPPYAQRLVVLPLYLQRTNRLTLLWDIEPESYPEVADRAQRIADHVVERAEPGSIILMHLMYGSRQTSREAVPLVVAGLRERGYRLVTVNQLLAAARPKE